MTTSVHCIRSCRTRNKSDFDQETLTNLSAGLRAWVTGSAERRAGTLPEMPRWLAAPLSLLLWATCVLLVPLWTPPIGFYRLATFRSDPDPHRVRYLFHRIAVLPAALNRFLGFP